MLTMPRLAVLAAMLIASVPALAATYDAHYRVEADPAVGNLRVELKLSGEQLPGKLVFSIDPQRHRNFTSTDSVEIQGASVTWRPRGKYSRLHYDFVVNHERAPGRFDSLMTQDWALFRADKLVPRVRVTAARGLESRATMEFQLPAQWTAVSAYPTTSDELMQIDDPERRFDRPLGWMLIGKLGKRSESIGGVQTIVAAPAGDNARRQDMLSFLNWNLPHLLGVFPEFPRRLLVVSAGDPLWRGGLSAPASLFLHASRPLISENRTSTLLHELVHVAMGIHGDGESDWIVEGLAEYYSIETLHRSGGISEQRYTEAMERLAKWGSSSINLMSEKSSGATTARAVIVMREVDAEIRSLTRGKASLDDVARELARRRGEVSLELLQATAQKIAGNPLKSLDRATLSGQTAKPAPTP
ncbi:hypothetical protein [Povalibacter sp.]|uniref:hypothetical protein n=1 Tax=Povalibacter sp. TaxID=1962978 RepID=UPI002F3F311D